MVTKRQHILSAEEKADNEIVKWLRAAIVSIRKGEKVREYKMKIGDNVKLEAMEEILEVKFLKDLSQAIKFFSVDLRDQLLERRDRSISEEKVVRKFKKPIISELRLLIKDLQNLEAIESRE